MFHMNSNRDWLLKRAEEEANGFLCVGGLVHSLAQAGASAQAPDGHHTDRLAFARLVMLRRRQLRLNAEQLAEKADVDLEEIVSIESGDEQAPEPRTIHQLAHVLRLPVQRLMQLSGLAEARDGRFRQETVRFAARSEPIEKLSRAELDALEEYVKYLGTA